MAYRYDLHCHTKEGSKCSDISIKKMVELYHEMGYSGICITNHFTGLTNPLPDDTPWHERVNFFYNIYQKAYEEGAKLGLTVFFGMEYALVHDINYPSQSEFVHFLFLNIDKDWLIENKDAFCEKPQDLFSRIREAGGFIIHAHPMLGDELRLFPYYVDAVEVINGGVNNSCNENAKIYAKMYGLAETAGTDIHRYDKKIMAGVETEKPCNTISELVCAIKEACASPFFMDRHVTDYWQQTQNDANETRMRNDLDKDRV